MMIWRDHIYSKYEDLHAVQVSLKLETKNSGFKVPPSSGRSQNRFLIIFNLRLLWVYNLRWIKPPRTRVKVEARGRIRPAAQFAAGRAVDS